MIFYPINFVGIKFRTWPEQVETPPTFSPCGSGVRLPDLSLSLALSLSLGLTHYSQVEFLGVRYKSVDLGATQSLGVPLLFVFGNLIAFRSVINLLATTVTYTGISPIRTPPHPRATIRP